MSSEREKGQRGDEQRPAEARHERTSDELQAGARRTDSAQTGSVWPSVRKASIVRTRAGRAARARLVGRPHSALAVIQGLAVCLTVLCGVAAPPTRAATTRVHAMSRSPDPQLRPPRPADDNPGSGSDSGSNSAEDEQEEVYEVEAVRASRYDESAGAMR